MHDLRFAFRSLSVRFAAGLFAAFGSSALLLAFVGVYGVKAFAVARRTREFGIHLALDARPRKIHSWLMRQRVAQIAIGRQFKMPLSLQCLLTQLR